MLIEWDSQPTLFLCIKKVCAFADTHTITSLTVGIKHFYCDLIITYYIKFVKQK